MTFLYPSVIGFDMHYATVVVHLSSPLVVWEICDNLSFSLNVGGFWTESDDRLSLISQFYLFKRLLISCGFMGGCYC